MILKLYVTKSASEGTTRDNLCNESISNANSIDLTLPDSQLANYFNGNINANLYLAEVTLATIENQEITSLTGLISDDGSRMDKVINISTGTNIMNEITKENYVFGPSLTYSIIGTIQASISGIYETRLSETLNYVYLNISIEHESNNVNKTIYVVDIAPTLISFAIDTALIRFNVSEVLTGIENGSVVNIQVVQRHSTITPITNVTTVGDSRLVIRCI